MTYTPMTFNVPELTGISKKTIEEHIKLYQGYVKHTNLILEELHKENPAYAKSEMQRRFAFEFNGMRNHEIYFKSFEGGSTAPSKNSKLIAMIEETYGSLDDFMVHFKSLALTRGIGWAMLGYDTKDKNLVQYWIDEQHLGHLHGVVPIIALDMWEHSFVADYQPSGKGQYVDDFFANVNWEFFEKRLEEVA